MLQDFIDNANTYIRRLNQDFPDKGDDQHTISIAARRNRMKEARDDTQLLIKKLSPIPVSAPLQFRTRSLKLSLQAAQQPLTSHSVIHIDSPYEHFQAAPVSIQKEDSLITSFSDTKHDIAPPPLLSEDIVLRL